jgi:diguanylate cyclase
MNAEALGEGRRFARRMHVPRAIGLAFGCFAIASVFWQREGVPAWIWAGLVFNGLVWPHLALLVALRSRDPLATERRSLVIDNLFGGAWIALMEFNLLPSAMIAVMLSMDKISAGGPKLLARSALALVFGCIGAGLTTGFALRPTTTMTTIVACLPLLLTYPAIVGYVTYRLSRRIREQNQRLAELSRTDVLSQVANRAHWEDAVEREYQRFRRHSGAACLLMLDIDHFKSINDRYGHPAGDEVIRNVAAILRECARGQDTVGRYGGEEFGLLLPETTLEGAAKMAERIRRRVEAEVLEPREQIRATVSIGIASVAADIQSRQQWIEIADRALYLAKSSGRNRVESA